jgi:hypothetical protein
MLRLRFVALLLLFSALTGCVNLPLRGGQGTPSSPSESPTVTESPTSSPAPEPTEATTTAPEQSALPQDALPGFQPRTIGSFEVLMPSDSVDQGGTVRGESDDQRFAILTRPTQGEDAASLRNVLESVYRKDRFKGEPEESTVAGSTALKVTTTIIDASGTRRTVTAVVIGKGQEAFVFAHSVPEEAANDGAQRDAFFGSIKPQDDAPPAESTTEQQKGTGVETTPETAPEGERTSDETATPSPDAR